MKKIKPIITPYVKVAFILFLIISAFVYAMFQGGFVSWFVFYSFIPFALYPLLLYIYPLKKIEVQRRILASEIQAGDQIQVELVLTRRHLFPLLYLTVEDELPKRFLKAVNQPPKGILFPFFQKEMKLTYTIPYAVRGDHHFQHVHIATGDFLNLYEKKVAVDCRSHFLVYPSYKQLTYRQLEAMYEDGHQTAFHRKQNETASISGVREYTQGDKQSWIHWKASARKNEMMTKDFEEQQNQDVMIIIDQQASPHFEAMVSFAATLTNTLIQNRIGVAFTSMMHFHQSIPAGKGEGQKQKILYALALLEENESDSVILFNRLIKGHTSYIFITSHLTKELLASIVSAKGYAAATVIVLRNQQDSSIEAKSQTEMAMRGVTCRYIDAAPFERRGSE